MLLLLVLSGAYPSSAAHLPVVGSNSAQEVFVPLAFCGSTRTIANIVWSCLATIIACAWVAVHPNVPKCPEVWWKIVRRRAMIMFCALVAPEFMIWWALRQRKGAKVIQQQFKSYANKKTWTITHAHLLQMGGFLLCDHDKKPLEILSQPTFAHLLDSNQISFPNITEQEILDKSKSDAFAKTVASFQAFWFILQIIARAAQRLPVSELEIVTLGYAVLNGAVYFLWWSKPLNVACPIPLYLEPGAGYHQTLKEKKARAKDLPEVPLDPTETKNESAGIQELSLEAQTAAPILSSEIFGCIPLPLQIIIGLILIGLIPALALAVLGICLAIAAVVIALALAVAIPFLIVAFIILTLGYATRVPFILIIYNTGQMMFSNAVEPCASHVPMYYAYDPTPPNQLRTMSFATSTIAGPFSSNHGNSNDAVDGQEHSADQVNTAYDDTHLLICGTLSIIFGAIHCVAWSFHFSTPSERILWRVCALSVTCLPLVSMIEALIRAVSKRSGAPLSQRSYVGLVLVLCWNLYATARLVLLVLVVIGLRGMPLEIFLAVRWVEFLPHY